MHFRSVMGFSALLALGCFVGCSMTNPTVRGQAPDNGVVNTGPIIGSAPGYGELVNKPYMGRHNNHDFRPYNGFRDNNFGYEGGFYAGPNGTFTGPPMPYTNGGGNCYECNSGQNCPAGGCPRCGRGCLNHHGFPQHYQTYQYNWPQNMVYPQTGAPAGMVQYPYYTLRGPTDFFMDKTPY